jgi:hypothetical protein
MIRGPRLRGMIVPADSLSNDMAALLCVLEEFERSTGKRPISSRRQPAELHDEAKSELANSATEDRCANPFVERIATAILKLRNQGPVGFIG